MKNYLLGTLTIFGLLSFFTFLTVAYLKDTGAWVQ